jgi:hypothetical protein
MPRGQPVDFAPGESFGRNFPRLRLTASMLSPLHKEALKHRLKRAEYRVFIVEGLPG